MCEVRGAKCDVRRARCDVRLGPSEVEARARCDVLVPVTSKPTISIVRVLMFLVLSFGMLTLLASPLALLQRRGESLLVNAMRVFVKDFFW